jgi:uncharacterized protein YxeA
MPTNVIILIALLIIWIFGIFLTFNVPNIYRIINYFRVRKSYRKYCIANNKEPSKEELQYQCDAPIYKLFDSVAFYSKSFVGSEQEFAYAIIWPIILLYFICIIINFEAKNVFENRKEKYITSIKEEQYRLYNTQSNRSISRMTEEEKESSFTTEART